jgi:hypothetical protein
VSKFRLLSAVVIISTPANYSESRRSGYPDATHESLKIYIKHNIAVFLEAPNVPKTT